MRILIDICHPAHVHFFKHAITHWKKIGHEIIVTSRNKECAQELLDRYNIPHIPIEVARGKSLIGLAVELFQRNKILLQIIRDKKPDILTAIGGIFIAQVGKIVKIPSYVFYDSDNATLQNLLTYPFTDHLIVPRCYNGWVPKKRTTRYNGYHELAYLHPTVFSPTKQVARNNGIDFSKKNYIIRLVSWQANHDIGHHGLSLDMLEQLITFLKPHGNIIISSERTLPGQFKIYQYNGESTALHHVMAYCAGYIGESPTMASEAAMLGVPAIYTSSIVCGNMHEQETRYGLVYNLHTVTWPKLKVYIEKMLQITKKQRIEKKAFLLQDCHDVNRFIIDYIENTLEKNTALACTIK